MSLSHFNNKLSSFQNLQIDHAFIWAVDMENEREIEQLVCEAIQPRQNTINFAFKLAVAHGNINIIEYFLNEKYKHIMPDQDVIDRLFFESVEAGDCVPIIELLQNAASWSAIQDIQRYLSNNRKYASKCDLSAYIISLTEPNILKEISEKQLNYAEKMNKIMRVRNQFEVIFTNQRWINHVFLDAVHSHLKLTVYTLLKTKPTSTQQHVLQPDQATINDAFTHCVRKGYISMAVMLLDPFNEGLALVDQRGFDQAFLEAMGTGDADVCAWMLCGRYGYVPSQSVLDEFFIEYDRYWVYKRLGLTYRRSGTAISLLAEAQSDESAFQLLKVRASAAAQQIAEQELGRAQRRRRAMSMFRPASTDIHAFSGMQVDRRPEELEGDSRMLPVDEERDAADLGEESEMEEDNAEDPQQDDLIYPADVRAQQHPSRPPRSTETVQAAVVRYLERTVTAHPLSTQQVTQRMGELIETHFTTPEEQNSTMQVVSRGMSDENVRVLGLTLQYLDSQHPDAFGLWIQGFLAESVAMNSCQAGAMERILTGLRGVSDGELRQIFTQAEGPHLARLFLSTFNIYPVSSDARSVTQTHSNAHTLAEVLYNAGVREDTEEVQIAQALVEYAQGRIAECGVSVAPLREDIQRVVETVCDGYKEYIRPIILSLLSA